MKIILARENQTNLQMPCIYLEMTETYFRRVQHKVQLAKRPARGYRNMGNFINMIYLALCETQWLGKLEFNYPLYFT